MSKDDDGAPPAIAVLLWPLMFLISFASMFSGDFKPMAQLLNRDESDVATEFKTFFLAAVIGWVVVFVLIPSAAVSFATFSVMHWIFKIRVAWAVISGSAAGILTLLIIVTRKAR